MWGWYFHILCFHIWLPFPSEFYCLILYSEVREGKGVYASCRLRKYTQPCVWTYTFLLLLFQGFDLMDSCQLLHERHISLADTPIHRVCSIFISRNSVKDYILCACRVVGSICHQWEFRIKKFLFITQLNISLPLLYFCESQVCWQFLYIYSIALWLMYCHYIIQML